MRYFKKEDFDKCMEFLADMPDTVETQQKLYNFMHKECPMLFNWNQITVKDFEVYVNIYIIATKCPKRANWCTTMSDGSQVVWNRKYQEFYKIDEIGTRHCKRIYYLDMFPELKDIDKWLLENGLLWWFRETQRQLIAIWNGKYDEHYKNYWR